MRGRKKHYIDIVLNPERVQRLSEGYTVQIVVNKQSYAITKEAVNPL